MADNPQKMVQELRDSIERLETDIGAAGLDQSIRAAEEIARKLKKLRSDNEDKDATLRAAARAPIAAASGGDGTKDAIGTLQKREYVVLALEEIGRPASPAFISNMIKKFWNADVPATQFASIRKGDERAWMRGRRTRPLIVPALNAFDLSARPRTCAVSTWPAERRVMGSLSDRADALRILLHAANQKKNSDTWQYAVKAIASDFSLGGPDRDVKQSVESAKAALVAISEQDDRDRKTAAERLGRLSERWQLFGRPLSYDVVEGGKDA